MARNKNWVLLDATHRVLHEDPRRGFAQIYARLLELGFQPKRSSVREYVLELRAMGVLEPTRNRPRFPPLYPAYLLTELPDSRQAQVSSLLQQHATRVQALKQQARPRSAEVEQLVLFLGNYPRIDVLRGSPTHMLLTRGTEEMLRQLESDLWAAGVHPRLFIVEHANWTPAPDTAATAA